MTGLVVSNDPMRRRSDRVARSAVAAGALLLAALALYGAANLVSLAARWGASAAGVVLALGWIALAAIAWPIARGRIAGRRFALLLVVATVALRLAVLPIGLHGVPIGDPAIYPALARGVLGGQGMVFHDPATGVDFRALFPPGYPMLLAIVGAVLPIGPWLLWLLDTLAALAGAALIVRLGARIGSAAAGRAAAWLFATMPVFVLAAPFAQKEPVVTLLVLALALRLLALRGTPMPGWRDGAVFGVLAGALALTQPALASLAATLVIVLAPRLGWGRTIALGLRAIPAFVLVLLPWWIRNMVVLGHVVPLTSTAGLGLWIGNNPQATGNWMAAPPWFRGMPELVQSRTAALLARDWIVGHPIAFVRLTATKFVRACALEQTTLVRFAAMTPPVPGVVSALLFPVLQTSLVATLAAGAALARRAARGGGGLVLRLLLACLVQIWLYDIWFEFGERHRYYVAPFVLLAIGFGLAAPVRRGRSAAA